VRSFRRLTTHLPWSTKHEETEANETGGHQYGSPEDYSRIGYIKSIHRVFQQRKQGMRVSVACVWRNPNPRYPNQCEYHRVGNILLLHYIFVQIAYRRIGDLLKFHGNRALKERRWWSERTNKCSKYTVQRHNHLQSGNDGLYFYAGFGRKLAFTYRRNIHVHTIGSSRSPQVPYHP
jgi:hypothetical protein